MVEHILISGLMVALWVSVYRVFCRTVDRDMLSVAILLLVCVFASRALLHALGVPPLFPLF